MHPSDDFRSRSSEASGTHSPHASSQRHVPHQRRWRRLFDRRAAVILSRAARTAQVFAQWLFLQGKRHGWGRIVFFGGGIFIILFTAYLGILWITLPDVGDPTSLLAAQSTVITDRNGVELYRLYGEQDRTYVAGADIADNAQRAVIAIEDERFFQHGCIEVRSILRAVMARLVGSSVTGGASTLTQQLARNALLSRDRTITRKLREAMLACQLERVYDKEKLLELYLNWIPYGQNAYGIEQASHRYFGISSSELTLAQSATLAAIPQRPSYFSPYGSHVYTQVTAAAMERIKAGKVGTADDLMDNETIIGLLGTNIGTGSTFVYVGGRTDQVLKNMVTQGFVTEDERQAALVEIKTMEFRQSRDSIRAPHFVLWIKEQVEGILKEQAEEGLLEQGGLTIQTTLDWELQQAAEAVVTARHEEIERVYGARNMALVAMDPATREILAYVGNADFLSDEGESKVDMARAARQPGSSFKPFVYAAAFRKGYSPATILYDVPTKFGTDEPQNFDGSFWGLMNARQALGASRNIPAIKAFFLAGGEDAVLNLTEDMGVPSPKSRKRALAKKGAFDYGWPLAIGSAETPLLEMTNGYATLANAGMAKEPVSVLKVTDKRGALLPLPFSSREDEGRKALDPRIAYQVTSILSDVSVRPNDFWKSVLSVPGFQAAAKTGTSNKCLDRSTTGSNACRVRKPESVWTLGYTPNLAAGVWVGNANSEALADRADGLNVAAPLWKDFMVRAHVILENKSTDFRVPSGIVQPQISLLSGNLPALCTPPNLRRGDVFLSERAPTQPDSACTTMTVDRVTGLLASAACPSEAQESRSFFLPSSVLADRWPSWEQGIQAWARSPDAVLPLPLPPAEACDVGKTPGRLIKPTVRIVSPGEGGLAPYPAFQPEITFSVGSSASGVVFLLDGKVVAEETLSPFKPVIRVPRSIAKEGVHTLEVHLRDNYYNLARDSVTFRFSDNADQISGPAARIVQPIIGTTVPRGEEVVMLVSADAPAGIKYVEFYLDELLLVRLPREPYQLSYALNVSPGTHVIRVVAVDMLNKAIADEIEIIVTE